MDYFKNDLASIHDDLVNKKYSVEELTKSTFDNIKKVDKEIEAFLKLDEERAKCEIYWNDLMGKYEVPAFCELDKEAPERIAANYIPLIQRYLDWYKNEYQVLKNKVEAVGLSCNDIFQYNALDSEIKETDLFFCIYKSM